MEPEKADEILSLLLSRASGTAPDKQASKLHPSRERSVARAEGKVVLIPMFGIMGQRRLPGESTGPGVQTELVGRIIDDKASDSRVKAIILQIDSPGGTVEGTPELAAKVAAASKRKPVIAQVDSLAASAAYWVATQASEVVVTPGGQVGSIGVRMMHQDISGQLEQEGVKIEQMSAGKYKTEGHPFGPLDDDARAHFQDQIDDAYRDFVGAVASGRSVSTGTVEENYGQGRVLLAKQALKAGMVDRIATLDQTLARFIAPQTVTTHQRRARAAQAIARTRS
jgi:signal peptide peptidase SppA